MSEREPPLSPIADSTAVPKKRTRISLVWFIPVVAALVGVWVAVTRVLSEGPKIIIIMQSAEGLEAGKTKIRYNGVDIGTVTAIRLSDDHQHVITTAQMAPKTDGFLAEDTEFWVVRPRISGANVTGLGTLISGAYIGLEIGQSKKPKRDFVALETTPVITGETPAVCSC
jgi:paraquat-inducible protein B